MKRLSLYGVALVAGIAFLLPLHTFALGVVGDRCDPESATSCSGNLVCDLNSDTCVSAPGNLGQSCDASRTSPCSGNLVCDNGTCAAPPASAGQACNPEEQNSCEGNLICNNGVCQAPTSSSGGNSGGSSGTGLGSGTTGTGVTSGVTSAGPNVQALTPYRDAILFLINGIFVPVLLAVAFIIFLFGVYRYFILGAENEESRAKGRQLVLWGVIGFAVIVSFWGLVALAVSVFSFTPGGSASSNGLHPPTL